MSYTYTINQDGGNNNILMSYTDTETVSIVTQTPTKINDYFI